MSSQLIGQLPGVVAQEPGRAVPAPSAPSKLGSGLKGASGGETRGARAGLALALAFGRARLTRRSQRRSGGARAAEGGEAIQPTATAIEPLGSAEIARVPENLYELLGVQETADADEIKHAYYDKMKICHPDIAGDDGEEICILLNDAYDLLQDPQEKQAYDIQLRKDHSKPVLAPAPVVSTDLSATWAWTSKAGNKKAKPTYNGRPLSRSLHNKVPPEGQGDKWSDEKFVFVDEWTCIACRNCCDVAPRTFCIDADAGRARAFAQWGNTEELLDYAVQACPVDCIYWVSREELQVLEYVTRDRLYESGNTLPCSMAARQGAGSGVEEDPFSMAVNFQNRLEEEEERRQRAEAAGPSKPSEMQERIRELFGNMSERLRTAGWG
ncbi:unnamed protein product [Effrenium voratum]|nr:unnamed protein product [Effrenium voratum]